MVLAEALDKRLFEVHFASTLASKASLDLSEFRFWPIESVSSERFLKTLASGKPVYDEQTLQSYVNEDLKLIEAVQPDFVVGDFRLSLSVSCHEYRIPFASIVNAYWSEYSLVRQYPIPDLPLTRAFGVGLPNSVFQVIRPWVFRYHARPLNYVRKRYGMPPLKNLLQTYTIADHVFYADIPHLLPTRSLPANHHYLGPIIWSASGELPDWWSDLDRAKPTVYVNLGSSGPVHTLSALTDTLASMPVNLVLGTAGRWAAPSEHSNVWAANFLPGDKVARQAALVICNGGSPTVYQALAEGVPVLGIPSNMDQHLMMQAVVRAGAGIAVRSEQTNKKNLTKAVIEILDNPDYRQSARDLQSQIKQSCTSKNFSTLMQKLLLSEQGDVG
jgi:UDP:flavonoid glycosyltransferase YjiC (YdhE family)